MTAAFTRILDHGATDRSVSEDVIARQLATSEALRSRLNEFGGVILGDEVGAGKTYVTFALLAEALSRSPEQGAVVFVPTELLKTKWCRQLRDYLLASMHDKRLARDLVQRITPVDRSLHDDGTLVPSSRGRRIGKNAILVARHSVYSYRTSEYDQAACVHVALDKLPEGAGRHRKAVLRACGLEPSMPGDWGSWATPTRLTVDALKPMRSVLRRYADGERDLWWPMLDAVHRIRRRVGRSSLPDAALVVIDEAHNLKSATSSVYSALLDVLDQRFDALLFLTATPFQLGRHELLHIVNFFRASRRHTGNEESFTRRRQELGDAMDRYIETLDRFGDAWRDLDEPRVAATRILIASQADGHDPLVAETADAFARVEASKVRLEKAMRPFLVRSTRDRDHREHGPVDERYLSESARIPLALVDRLLVETLRETRTFVSSALISACSSWEALRVAAVMSDDGRPPSHTRTLLRQLGDKGLLGTHPKVAQTVGECVQAVLRGEKTLVFVERDQTGRVLRDLISSELEAHKADDLSSTEAQLQRLQDRTRFGWPSLRENYLHTLYPRVFTTLPTKADLDRAWAQASTKALWPRVDPAGEKHDFAVEKRFWEHILFTDAARRAPNWERSVVRNEAESVERILEPDYILNGLDLRSGDTGERIRVPLRPLRDKPREPRMPFAVALLSFRSPWAHSSESLAELSPDDRAAFVDAAAAAFARSHFRAEIAAVEVDGDPARHFQAVDRLLRDPGGPWPSRFATLADQARDAVRTSEEDLAASRISDLISSLASEVRVQFINGNTKKETRQRAVDGFNTPLYPEIIVTTPVLAEGLDLHRSCRRVIHHDLPWNPAKLEQRTGRIDRVGSLSERLRRDGAGDQARIEVWLPYVPGTYDEFIHERVIARRREFRCLLGSRPEWNGDGELGENEEGLPVAEELVDRLQVRLGPA